MTRRVSRASAGGFVGAVGDTFELAIGKAPVVLMIENAGKMAAVVTTLTAQPARVADRKQRAAKGTVRLAPDTLAHLLEDVLPHANQVAELLSVPPIDLELCAAKPAAARVHGLDAVVSGTSLDVSAWLVQLSSDLALPLRQDTACTGAIDAVSDDLHPVQGLVEKLAAVRASPSIRRFVCPPMDEDQSIERLAPQLSRRTAEALQEAARDIEVITARNLADVLRACATDAGMVTSALRRAYFDRRLDNGIRPSPHDGVIRVLSEQLHERFWDCLRAHVHAARTAAARGLLQDRADFQVRAGRYPPGFGIKLANLLRSVPAATRQRRAFFPLVPPNLCFRLAQLADEAQVSDATMLVIAASGMLPLADGRKRSRKPAKLRRDDVESHFEALMTAISAETLAREIGLPIDEARISFPLPSIVIGDNDLFTSTCTSFFVAMSERLAITPPAPVQADSANELLAQAFAQEGGIDAAWEEARFAVRAGMRFVLDRMTDTYKQKLQVAHVKRVLEHQLNQLPWTDRRALMQRLLDTIGALLPSDVRGMDPARLVRECDRIAWAYVSALDRAAAVFRRY